MGKSDGSERCAACPTGPPQSRPPGFVGRGGAAKRVSSPARGGASDAQLAPTWLGWLDSNQRMRESKSRALPLGYTPSKAASATMKKTGWMMGIEPTNAGATIRCVSHFTTSTILKHKTCARRDSNPRPSA